jgi:hemoglobin-like flavoprotein
MIRLFVKCPNAKIIFGFDSNDDPYSDEIILSSDFKRNASIMIEMFNSAFNMLGPDIDILSEILQDVGVKHARYGVTVPMFHAMQECLVQTLQDIIGIHKFTPTMKQAFTITYETLSADLIAAQTRVKL